MSASLSLCRRAHTVTVLFILTCVLVYVTLLEETPQDTTFNTKRLAGHSLRTLLRPAVVTGSSISHWFRITKASEMYFSLDAFTVGLCNVETAVLQTPCYVEDIMFRVLYIRNPLPF